jgi:hypothetical protein
VAVVGHVALAAAAGGETVAGLRGKAVAQRRLPHPVNRSSPPDVVLKHRRRRHRPSRCEWRRFALRSAGGDARRRRRPELRTVALVETV